jgi:hypothetical protein
MVHEFECATGITIYQGSAVAVDSSGKLVPSTHATAVKCVGRACATVVSAAANELLKVEEGIFLYGNGTGTLSDSDRFQPCFFEYDQTVQKTGTIFAGLVYDVTSAGVYVFMSPFIPTPSSGKVIAGGAAYTVRAGVDDGAVVETATDNAVITLPLASTCKGMKITVRNTGADGAALVSIDPNALDGVSGSIANAAADSVASNTVNKDWRNTKATANKGDYCTLQSDGGTLWYVSGGVGIWASEP